jgi:hypothetical protein
MLARTKQIILTGRFMRASRRPGPRHRDCNSAAIEHPIGDDLPQRITPHDACNDSHGSAARI